MKNISNNKYVIIPNAAIKINARRKSNDNGRFQILSFGYLSKLRGLDALIKIAKSRPDIEVMIIGTLENKKYEKIFIKNTQNMSVV